MKYNKPHKTIDEQIDLLNKHTINTTQMGFPFDWQQRYIYGSNVMWYE